ncbi:hypothetical protein ACLOJK_001027 [Asimina triloba]
MVTANAVLEGACERAIVGDLYCDIPLGLYVIRGENVVLIGELDLEQEELPAHMTRVSAAEIKRSNEIAKDQTKPKLKINQSNKSSSSLTSFAHEKSGFKERFEDEEQEGDRRFEEEKHRIGSCDGGETRNEKLKLQVGKNSGSGKGRYLRINRLRSTKPTKSRSGPRRGREEEGEEEGEGEIDRQRSRCLAGERPRGREEEGGRNGVAGAAGEAGTEEEGGRKREGGRGRSRDGGEAPAQAQQRAAARREQGSGEGESRGKC